MKPHADGNELPADANDALLQLAELLQLRPDAVLEDAMDSLESAHGVGPTERTRPMPRLNGRLSTWMNLERSLDVLVNRQADLDEAFAMHKRACKAKMRYARHRALWDTLLKALFALVHTNVRSRSDAAARELQNRGGQSQTTRDLAGEVAGRA